MARRSSECATEAALIDAAVIDGAVTEPALIDAAVIDGAVTEAALIDAAVIDGAVTEAAANLLSAGIADALAAAAVTDFEKISAPFEASDRG